MRRPRLCVPRLRQACRGSLDPNFGYRTVVAVRRQEPAKWRRFKPSATCRRDRYRSEGPERRGAAPLAGFPNFKIRLKVLLYIQ